MPLTDWLQYTQCIFINNVYSSMCKGNKGHDRLGLNSVRRVNSS